MHCNIAFSEYYEYWFASSIAAVRMFPCLSGACPASCHAPHSYWCISSPARQPQLQYRASPHSSHVISSSGTRPGWKQPCSKYFLRSIKYFLSTRTLCLILCFDIIRYVHCTRTWQHVSRLLESTMAIHGSTLLKISWFLAHIMQSSCNCHAIIMQTWH